MSQQVKSDPFFSVFEQPAFRFGGYYLLCGREINDCVRSTCQSHTTHAFQIQGNLTGRFFLFLSTQFITFSFLLSLSFFPLWLSISLSFIFHLLTLIFFLFHFTSRFSTRACFFLHEFILLFLLFFVIRYLGSFSFFLTNVWFFLFFCCHLTLCSPFFLYFISFVVIYSTLIFSYRVLYFCILVLKSFYFEWMSSTFSLPYPALF